MPKTAHGQQRQLADNNTENQRLTHLRGLVGFWEKDEKTQGLSNAPHGLALVRVAASKVPGSAQGEEVFTASDAANTKNAIGQR